LAVPLAGCFSVIAPKPIPDWAMSAAAETEYPRARTSRRAAARQVAIESTDSTAATTTGNAAMPTGTVRRPAASRPSGPTAYTPEWHAEEKAADERLRRRMNICVGC
jgi:hypothetical protein